MSKNMISKFFGWLIFLFLSGVLSLFKIRIGLIKHYNRIGHLSAFSELYLRRRFKSREHPREKHIFFCGPPANRQMLTMIQRCMTVIENGFLVKLFQRLRSLRPEAKIWVDLPGLQNSYEDFSYTDPQMSFTRQEEEKGEKLLKQMGIKPGTAFVCLHVRDGRYLEKMIPDVDWSYHSYRDCRVENYYSTIGYLTSLGIPVLRMGQIFEKDLSLKNPLLIDYAKHFRSDFGDIYLSAKCRFFIASEGGLNSVAWTFNVPVVYTNGIPTVTAVGWRKGDIFIHKKLWLASEKRFLTYPEIMERRADLWMRTEDYQKAGVELIENSPQEILGAVKEMVLRLEGSWEEKEEEKKLRDRYRSVIPENHPRKRYLSDIGIDYLKLNEDLLGNYSCSFKQ